MRFRCRRSREAPALRVPSEAAESSMVSNPAILLVLKTLSTTHRLRAHAERVYVVLQHTLRLPVDVRRKIQSVVPQVTPYATQVAVTICTRSSAPIVTTIDRRLNAARLVLKACN